MWWFSSGWIPDAHQSCSITLFLSSPEKRKYSESVMNKEKEKRDHSPIPIKSKRKLLGNLGEIIYYQIRVGMRKKSNL